MKNALIVLLTIATVWFGWLAIVNCGTERMAEPRCDLTEDRGGMTACVILRQE